MLSNEEIRRLIELCDEGPFNGPEGLGERCYDILCCCFERAESVLYDIVTDQTAPMERRANTLVMLNYGNFDELLDAANFLLEDMRFKEILVWIFGSEEEIRRQIEET